MSQNGDGPLRQCSQGVEIDVWVCPRSSRNAIAGIHRGRIKLQIQAPPVDGAANRGAKRVLARSLGVAPGRIQCIRGASSRNKTFTVEDLDVVDAAVKLGLGGGANSADAR